MFANRTRHADKNQLSAWTPVAKKPPVAAFYQLG
ncbi:hypothetical protein CBM2633_U10039 [Cupriavidus taiwanensis]|nr:hypothetical protein CBM2633_U10039 [Cupriavidus taiwanensis]